MLVFWLSVLMAVGGCLGLILAGKGKWYGWAIGLSMQPIWFIFGIVTKGYGLCLTALMYGTVYGKNLYDWRKKALADRPVGS